MHLTRFHALCIVLVVFSASIKVQADDIDDFLIRQMEGRRIPGLQIVVVQNNRIVKTANYGIANVQDAVTVTDETVFTINSMTKAFVGVAVMQLVEREKIELTAGISTYLADLPESWRAITVNQLLTHTSGLPNIMNNDAQLISNKGEEASWQLVQQQPLDSEANSRFSYNQTNYLLLGKIIENVSGQSFVNFIKQNQLQRVGMKRTEDAGFAHFEGVVSHQARGYTYYKTGKLTTINEVFPPLLRTAAGMSSNAKELARWLIALQSGQLLENQSSIEILWSPAVLSNGEIGGFNRLLNGYALGWPVIQRPTHRAVVSAGGDRAAMVVYPDDNLSIVVLTNLMGAVPERFIDEVAGFYVPGLKAENGFGLSVATNSLRQRLDSEGYENALIVAEELQNSNGITFNEDELNTWGYRLIDHLRMRPALEIFRLNTHLFPNSANTYDSLGEAYGLLGQAQDAINSYEKALELDPTRQNAAYQLERLSHQDH